MARFTDKITKLKIWRATGAEFVGTTLLVLLLCGIHSQTWGALDSDTSAAVVYFLHSAVYAFSVMSLSWSIQHVSGGYVNPVFTLAGLLTRKLSIIRTIFYLLAQCAGKIFLFHSNFLRIFFFLEIFFKIQNAQKQATLQKASSNATKPFSSKSINILTMDFFQPLCWRQVLYTAQQVWRTSWS